MKIRKIISGFWMLCALQPAMADSVALGEQITDGGFVSLASWDVSGSVVAQDTVNTINSNGGNSGFDSFFSSGFVSLGDAGGAIGGPPTSATSTLSQTFVLSGSINGASVLSYDLDISLFSVFDGDDSATFLDSFSATLNGVLLFSQTSAPLPDCPPSTACANNQIENNPFSTTLVGLAPGTYTLTFTLTEGGGATSNTAVGVDDVSIIATAHVPEPATLALMGLGLLALARRGLAARQA